MVIMHANLGETREHISSGGKSCRNNSTCCNTPSNRVLTQELTVVYVGERMTTHNNPTCYNIKYKIIIPYPMVWVSSNMNSTPFYHQR